VHRLHKTSSRITAARGGEASQHPVAGRLPQEELKAAQQLIGTAREKESRFPRTAIPVQKNSFDAGRAVIEITLSAPDRSWALDKFLKREHNFLTCREIR